MMPPLNLKTRWSVDSGKKKYERISFYLKPFNQAGLLKLKEQCTVSCLSQEIMINKWSIEFGQMSEVSPP